MNKFDFFNLIILVYKAKGYNEKLVADGIIGKEMKVAIENRRKSAPDEETIQLLLLTFRVSVIIQYPLFDKWSPLEQIGKAEDALLLLGQLS